MVESLLEDISEHIAESSKHLDRAKEVLNDACDDLLHESKQAFKSAHKVAGGFVEEAEHAVRKHPKLSMAGVMVIGMALGFFAGWVLASEE
jgi:ElaB/YqjD/DUF883 family membrane-anchored ribosome-binding protein